MIPYVETKQGLSVFIDGEMQEVPNTHPDFLEIRRLAYDGAYDAGLMIKQILTRALTAVRQAVGMDTSGAVTFEHGVVKFKGEPLHNSLTDRMLRMIDEGHSVTPLVNFLVKLMQNPSNRVVTHLYDFLQKGSIPITEDGDFLVYKAITWNWKDIHTGTIDNSIGATPEMPRNKVDEDPDRTCSNGLHVCSWDYLPHFSHANGRVVVCKVNPADVVAIPRDYNDTKMRVCRYEVVSEVTDYYKERNNYLATKSVFILNDDIEDEDEDEDETCNECGRYIGFCDCL